MLHVEYGWAQHQGDRNTQEDSLGADIGKNLFTVADGIGGNPRGEKASQLAVRTIGTHFNPANPASLKEAFHRANAAINTADAGQREKMGTTATALHFDGKKVHFAHAGDSRLYMLRGDKIAQISEDHERLYIDEKIPAAFMVIYSYLGCGMEELTLQSGKFTPKPGDKFMLCSDGIKSLKDEEIREIINKHENNPSTAAHELVKAALAKWREEHGNVADNITAMVLHIKTAKR